MPRQLPPATGLRVVGDVHGDLRAFTAATQTDLFLLQLGDLIDYGPDSAGVLRLMFRLIEQGRGMFLLGNHDLKLGRALAGRDVRVDSQLAATLRQLDPELRARAAEEIAQAPAWVQRRNGSGVELFVHGGFHTDMLDMEPPEPPPGHLRGVLARALYGEPTGRVQPDGFPERSLRWVDRIPAATTVYVGHDRRSSDGRPYVRRNRDGGAAIFIDTGAGKGGHLSWIDLPA
jgi:protein phosphatase